MTGRARLLLASEVLSLSSIRADRFTKRRLYQEHRVPLYWVIDPDEQYADVWRPEDDFPAIERQCLTWRPSGSSAAFEHQLGELFRAV